MGDHEYKKGLIFTIIGYFMWGIVPMYWKLIDDVNPIMILCNRIVWTCVLMAIFIVIKGDAKKTLFHLKNKKKMLFLSVAGIAVTINWGTFIWAVVSERILETSMGYFINPLVFVLASIVIFKEKVTISKIIAIVLAVIGVMIMIVQYNKVPVVAITLALSFASYGVLKKLADIDAVSSLFYEVLFPFPFVLAYGVYFETSVETSFLASPFHTLFLVGAGIITMIPLLLFGAGVKRINLSTIGFLQYIAPTMTFILGVFIYHESFDISQGITFGFIWAGLCVYSAPNVWKLIRKNK